MPMLGIVNSESESDISIASVYLYITNHIYTIQSDMNLLYVWQYFEFHKL